MRMKTEEELLAMLPEPSDAEKKRRMSATLADVDAGRTISHEKLLLWIHEELTDD